MDKKDFLYFEEDDTSEMGFNGKQVFVTKRINGRTTHNKAENIEKERNNKLSNKEKKEDKKSSNNEKKEDKKSSNNEKKEDKKSSNNEKKEDKKSRNKEKKEDKKLRNKEKEWNKKLSNKEKKNRLSKKENKRNNKLNKEEDDENDYLIIEIDKIHIPNEKINDNKKRRTSNSNKKNKKNNNNQIKNKKNNNNQIKDKKNNNNQIKNKKNNISKEKNKNKKKSNIIKIFILIILIIGTIIFALVSPTFNIQTINVQGNEKIDSQSIISLSDLQVGNNIFKNLKTDIIEKIKKNPYIEEVNVKRILPGTIEIDVKERTVAYQIKVIDSYVYLDYQGYILEKSTQKERVPIIEGISTSQEILLKDTRVLNDDIAYFNTMLKIMDNAKNLDMYDLITQINIENNEYILYLESEKKYVYLGDESNITNKMLYVQTIIENEREKSGKVYVDGNLDEGFKPYFREE